MGKLITVVAVVMVAMLLLPAVALAQAPRVSWIYGEVLVGGEKAPDDTVVSAWIEDAMVEEATTSDGMYVLTVAEPEGENYDGVVVSLKVDGSYTGVTRTWGAGEPFEANLSVGETPLPPGVGLKVEVEWSVGNSTLEEDTLTLYLGAKPADGAKGDMGATGAAGDPGEDAPGGVALPVVAIILAVIAVGVAMMSMRRRV